MVRSSPPSGTFGPVPAGHLGTNFWSYSRQRCFIEGRGASSKLLSFMSPDPKPTSRNSRQRCFIEALMSPEPKPTSQKLQRAIKPASWPASQHAVCTEAAAAAIRSFRSVIECSHLDHLNKWCIHVCVCGYLSLYIYIYIYICIYMYIHIHVFV